MRRASLRLLAVACLLALAAVPATNNSETPPPTTATAPDASCRANNGTRLRPPLYRMYSCMSCFQFMYSRAAGVMAKARRWLRFVNVTQFAADACAEFAAQEPKQAPPVAECADMLHRCCLAADACCGVQLARENRRLSAMTGEFCPATWDGLYCINATARGTVAEFGCPSYLPSANVDNAFTITCTEGSKSCT